MNPAVVITLKAFAYTALVLFASPLLEGIIRKIKALIHSRMGPPITQPYLDLMKLMVKEDLASETGMVARLAPPAAFAAVLSAAFFVPFGVGAPAAGAGDLFLFIYLITLCSVCVMAGALSHASPYSHLGSSREMMMVLTVEAVVIISLLTVAVSGHTAILSHLVGLTFKASFILSLACYLFAMQALLESSPSTSPRPSRRSWRDLSSSTAAHPWPFSSGPFT